MLNYKSTRGGERGIPSAQAILKGIAEDGGLYVPESIPKLSKSFEELGEMSYKEIALYVLGLFFGDFTEEELKFCVDKAYDDKFKFESITPIEYHSGVYFLELFHGRTLAFKDVALSILPYLLKTAAKKCEIDKEIVILTATSGDTGKAALEGFSSVEGTNIIVFYPKDGVSDVQRLQMTTQEGKNTLVVGIAGNFDDAQSGVKAIFTDVNFKELLDEKGYMLSSANSINIGRLIPQVVYYIYSYVTLLKQRRIEKGEEVNIVVPTGNFGNILAAYYSKKMGLPVGKLICASNKNNVLSDFITTGVYDRRREFYVTNSPSMDILISSNLERFLYDISDENPVLTNELMKDLKEKGIYEITENMKEKLSLLYGGYSTEEETLKAIKKIFDADGYVIDTHTAVGYDVYEKYKAETGDERVAIIAATASPFKFPRSICEALDIDTTGGSDFKLIDEISSKFGLEIPENIEGLDKREVKHTNTCSKNELREVIINFLNGQV